MKESIVYGQNLPEAYHKALSYLDILGEVVDCPEYNTRCKEMSMTMVVNHPLDEPRISRCGIFGPEDLQQYVMEILDGIMDFEYKEGKWEYTYHTRMVEYYNGNLYDPGFFDQIQMAEEMLRKNPNTRQAVIDVRHMDDIGSDDPACLQHIQFFIRDGKMDMKVLFRSNDAVKATFMNAFALIQLQGRIAGELGVTVGQYVHRANSFHAYERDWGMLDGFCDRMGRDEALTYTYAGDWQEQMEDAVPGIMEKVRRLRDE